MSHRLQPSANVVWACVAGCVALVGFNLWLGAAYSVDPPVAVGSEVATASAFAFSGLAAWWLRPRSLIGPWMAALGAVALIANLLDLHLIATMPGHRWAILVGELVFWFQYALAGHVVLTYPSGRPAGQAERVLILTTYAVAAATGIVLLLTLTPDPRICANWCFDSPIRLVANRQLYLEIRSAVVAVWVVLAVAAVVLLIRRVVRANARQRRTLSWALAAFAVAAVLFALFAIAVNVLGVRSTGALVFVYGHQWFGVLALPVVFFIGLLRQRLAFASVGRLVGHLNGATADNVEALLRTTLQDPELRVLFPTPGRWLDTSGAAYPLSPDEPRTVLPLGDPPFAMLLHDPELAEEHELLAAAAAAAHLALDNARLRALTRPQSALVPVVASVDEARGDRAANGPVFISYSRTDQTYVDRLAAFLAADGIPVWYDHSIETGQRFARIIQHQIDACAAVVVVMTPAAMTSEWVDIEVTYAVAKRKRVFPLLLSPCESTILLTGLNWEDVTSGRLPSGRFVSHLRSLTGHDPAVHSDPYVR